MDEDPREIAKRVLSGDRRAAARAITLAETGCARELIGALYAYTGRAQVVGITGPPGSGKSTLVDRFIEAHRKAGRTVAVVAVDPSSPFTGGALLGDRLRMEKRQTDPGVFIRSMATRGHLGGLARATADATRILDAAGFDIVIVETVGVGQSEVDVIRLADTVVVVAVPGMGDEVQAIKAGLMEIGDVFVVNKADHDGADRAVAEIQAWLEAVPGAWTPPVLKTIALTGEGVDGLLNAVEQHRSHVHDAGLASQRRRRQAQQEIMEIIREGVVTQASRDARLDALVSRVAQRALDPYAAAEQLRDP